MPLRADDHDEVVRTAQAHGSGDDGSHYSSALAHVQQNVVRHTNAVVMYMELTQILRRRVSMVNLSMRALSKTRIARPMRKAPVVVYLQHPWAALRPSRYACKNRFNNSSFEPPSCLGIQKVYIWWWWRWRWWLAVTTDQHGYGRGFQAL